MPVRAMTMVRSNCMYRQVRTGTDRGLGANTPPTYLCSTASRECEPVDVYVAGAQVHVLGDGDVTSARGRAGDSHTAVAEAGIVIGHTLTSSDRGGDGAVCAVAITTACEEEVGHVKGGTGEKGDLQRDKPRENIPVLQDGPPRAVIGTGHTVGGELCGRRRRDGLRVS